jgi:hypothetical protein
MEPAPKTRRPETTINWWSGSSRCLLRETHDKSNFLLLRIPIEIANSRKGKKSFSISRRYLPSSVAISEDAIARLRQHGLIRELEPTPEKRSAIDYEALKHTYRQLLETGSFKIQADLARHLGVSRVWVSRILKGIKKKTP